MDPYTLCKLFQIHVTRLRLLGGWKFYVMNSIDLNSKICLSSPPSHGMNLNNLKAGFWLIQIDLFFLDTSLCLLYSQVDIIFCRFCIIFKSLLTHLRVGGGGGREGGPQGPDTVSPPEQRSDATQWHPSGNKYANNVARNANASLSCWGTFRKHHLNSASYVLFHH